MKTTLILTGLMVVVAGCGTASSSRQARDHPIYQERRVEGQWAREAGMHERQWTTREMEFPAIESPAVTREPVVAQGGASTAGQEITVSTGSAGLEILNQAEINLHKEELVVGKREVSNGGVLVRTVVQSEEVKQPVELKREEYVIERIPAGSAKDAQMRSENAFQGREIYIPLMKEEAISGKRTLLTEAITLGKKLESDQKTVSLPVRTEDVQVVKNPNLSDPKFSTVPRRTAGAGMITSAAPAAEATPGTLKLAREEFLVGKQEADNGGVYLQKVIRTETASQPVELKREEYMINRKAISGEVAADFTPKQIQLGLNREEAVAGTRSFVAETVRVRKQLETDQQIVSATVRKETAEVVRLPEGSLVGQGGTAVQSTVSTISETGSSECCCEGMTRDEILSYHVKASLAKGDGAMPGYSNIQISSDSGVVTLQGTVSSEAEKKLITKKVKKMSGVRSVKNELRVVNP